MNTEKLKQWYLIGGAVLIVLLIGVVYLIVHNAQCGTATVVKTSPTDQAVNVDVASVISIQFSRAIPTTALAITISPSFSYSTAWQGTTLRISPRTNLSYNTHYAVTVGNVAHASCAALQKPYTFSFTSAAQQVILPNLPTTGPSTLPVIPTVPTTPSTSPVTVFSSQNQPSPSTAAYNAGQQIYSQYPGLKLKDEQKLPVLNQYYSLDYYVNDNDFLATVTEGPCQQTVQMINTYLTQNGIDPNTAKIVWFAGPNVSQSCASYVNGLNH